MWQIHASYITLRYISPIQRYVILRKNNDFSSFFATHTAILPLLHHLLFTYRLLIIMYHTLFHWHVTPHDHWCAIIIINPRWRLPWKITLFSSFLPHFESFDKPLATKTETSCCFSNIRNQPQNQGMKPRSCNAQNYAQIQNGGKWPQTLTFYTTMD